MRYSCVSQPGEQCLHPDRPVYRVTWYNARAYCEWLNDRLHVRISWYEANAYCRWFTERLRSQGFKLVGKEGYTPLPTDTVAQLPTEEQ